MVLLCAAVFSVILFLLFFKTNRVRVEGVEDVEEVYRWSQHCARIRTRIEIKIRNLKGRCGFSNFVVQMLLGFLDLRSTPKVTIPIMRSSKEKIK